jgi:hypothetical protein
MEATCFLRCFQQLENEPHESNPHITNYLFKIHFNIILPPTPASSSGSSMFFVMIRSFYTDH